MVHRGKLKSSSKKSRRTTKRTKSVGQKIISFLYPSKSKIVLFVAIILVHVVLSAGHLGNYAYSLTISIYYSVFNLPLAFIPYLTLFPTNLYLLGMGFAAALVAHLIYWYIIGCFFGIIRDEKRKEKKYKYGMIAVTLFLLFYILFSIIVGILYGEIFYRYLSPY